MLLFLITVSEIDYSFYFKANTVLARVLEAEQKQEIEGKKQTDFSAAGDGANFYILIERC